MPPGDHGDDRVGGLADANGFPDADLVVLQAALLPASVPILPRVALGARYLLAEADAAAGGDWFDTVVRPDGSLGLVVGDVVGHGVAASATMGQLRAVARHCLGSTASPVDVVRALDRFARQLDDAQTATVCVAVLQPTTGAVRFCTAGHPPPLLIAAPEYRYLPAAGGAPLATGAVYAEAVAQMAEDDLLLLYTDGIIERPLTHPAEGRIDLAEVATHVVVRWADLDGLTVPQRVCDQTIVQLTQLSGYRDDVTLLAAQRRAPVGRVELSLPNTPLAVTTTRAALDAWSAALRVDDITTNAIQHAVGEVVTNAVEHAYRDRPGVHPIEVHAELTDAGIAEVVVADRGRWREPVDQLYRGMGLTMAAELVDGIRIDRRESGTTVRLRQRLCRTVTMSTRSVDGPAVLADDEPFMAALTAVDDPDAVLVVRGPVDVVGAAELRDQLRSATGNGTVSRTVDLSRVTLLASAAVHVLHEAQDRSTAHHEHLRLLAPAGSAAHHVLELVGLHPTENM
ncbi:MAG: SpoIIE family protein phosphatase [Pseudonocardia sp.]|nr:SpoIIE family protein phosphatase [Pseudonocardia sp.]